MVRRRLYLKNVVFDLETDGLLPELTRIHSLVVADLDSEQVVSCTDDDPSAWNLRVGLDLLARAERVYGHNIIGFDLPAIQKLYPSFKLSGQAFDTYVVASFRWAHIRDTDFARSRRGQLPPRLIGRHTLEAWGYRLGVLKDMALKDDETAFDAWTPELQAYCEQDVRVTKALVEHIRKAGVPSLAVETEHELAEYLTKQEQNGWPFDVEKAVTLQAALVKKKAKLERKLQEFFPPWQKSLGEFTPKANNAKRGYKKGVPVERFKTVEFNPGSGQHIADRLQELYGWQPTVFTATGLPAVDENVLEGLDYPPVPYLKDYLLVTKRLGQLTDGAQAWLKHATAHGPRGGKLTGLYHIHGRVIQNRAVTHRAAHANPNLGQVPANYSPYGPECRELFYPGPEGWKQVGADVAGLELRCLAHYMAKYDGGQYAETVLAEKPNDPHTKNAEILASFGTTRDTAKTFFYAFLYGAGDEKLGKILVPGASPTKQQKVGKAARKTFLAGLPALNALVSDVKRQAARKGYLRLIDKRRCYIRSEHAALNSLLQGTGAVICKRWIVEFNRRLRQHLGEQGWDGQWAALGWIHDEVQLAVREEHTALVSSILINSIRAMTAAFNFRLPLDGSAIVGNNWKECH